MSFFFLVPGGTSAKEIMALDVYTNRMRKHPLFKSSIFVYIVERNHCQIKSNDICNWVQHRYVPCKLLCDNAKNPGTPGVWLRPEDKERFIRCTNAFLTRQRLGIFRDFITPDPSSSLFLLKQLQSQLVHYRRHVKPATDASLVEARSYVWSGKDKNGAMKDDMAVCLIQGLWHAVGFMADPRMTRPYNAQNVAWVDYTDFNRTYGLGSVVGVNGVSVSR
jgi:hypothetical protein